MRTVLAGASVTAAFFPWAMFASTVGDTAAVTATGGPSQTRHGSGVAALRPRHSGGRFARALCADACTAGRFTIANAIKTDPQRCADIGMLQSGLSRKSLVQVA